MPQRWITKKGRDGENKHIPISEGNRVREKEIKIPQPEKDVGKVDDYILKELDRWLIEDKVKIYEYYPDVYYTFIPRKAKKIFNLAYWDGNNWSKGFLFLSKKGIWYLYTPKDTLDGHRWEIVKDPCKFTQIYKNYLTDSQIKEIKQLSKC